MMEKQAQSLGHLSLTPAHHLLHLLCHKITPHHRSFRGLLMAAVLCCQAAATNWMFRCCRCTRTLRECMRLDALGSRVIMCVVAVVIGRLGGCPARMAQSCTAVELLCLVRL
jgi:hypothetical protein